MLEGAGFPWPSRPALGPVARRRAHGQGAHSGVAGCRSRAPPHQRRCRAVPKGGIGGVGDDAEVKDKGAAR
jgi:hypothetical protein